MAFYSAAAEKILVVDDDPDVLALAATHLAALGYEVLPASNGNQALALLRVHRDVVLLFTDIVMPNNIDGFDLAEHARRLRPGLKVLYTSGYLKDEGVWYGNLLPKPWTADDLDRAVKAALA